MGEWVSGRHLGSSEACASFVCVIEDVFTPKKHEYCTRDPSP